MSSYQEAVEAKTRWSGASDDNRRKAAEARSEANLWLDAVGRLPVLSAEDEADLIRRAARNNKAAVQHLILFNLRLVAYHSIKLYTARDCGALSAGDLLQEGYLGLAQAAHNVEPIANCRFATYASIYIKRYIQKAIDEQSEMIRLPAHICEARHTINKARRKFASQMATLPTQEQLATMTGFDLKLIQVVEAARGDHIPLEIIHFEYHSNDDESHLSPQQVEFVKDYLISDCEPTEELAIARIERLEVSQLLNELTEREREVICMRYGLKGQQAYTLTEMGTYFKVSKERIRQIESQAKKKLFGLMQSDHDRVCDDEGEIALVEA